jgi:hypothetical protein
MDQAGKQGEDEFKVEVWFWYVYFLPCLPPRSTREENFSSLVANPLEKQKMNFIRIILQGLV